MPEEKYVSIEYSIWENKYKNLEEQNDKLTATIKELEFSRRIDIYLHFNSFSLNHRRIGYIDFLISGAFKMNLKIEKEVKSTILQHLDRHQMYEPYLKKEEAIELGKKINSIVKDYNLAYDRLAEAKSKLPRIVRWLFKIK